MLEYQKMLTLQHISYFIFAYLITANRSWNKSKGTFM